MEGKRSLAIIMTVAALLIIAPSGVHGDDFQEKIENSVAETDRNIFLDEKENEMIKVTVLPEELEIIEDEADESFFEEEGTFDDNSNIDDQIKNESIEEYGNKEENDAEISEYYSEYEEAAGLMFGDGEENSEEEYLAFGTCGDDIKWYLKSEGRLILNGTGSMYNYSMHMKDMPWYIYRESIKTIEISEGITVIGEDAFSYSGVRNVKLPESLTAIESDAFYACDFLEEIQLPESLEYIGRGAFYGSGSLESITIPASVTFIGDSAFSACDNLQNIYVEGGTYYSDENGILYNADKTYLHSYPSGRGGACRVLEGTEEIGDNAFRYATQVSEIILPLSVQKINDYSFSYCRTLKNVSISQNVNHIGNGVFEGCINLENINVDENNVNYCDENGVLFDNEKITLMMVPCAMEVYNIPEGTECIMENAFSNSNIIDVSFPTTLKTIGRYAFDGCRDLNKIIIPANVAYIDYHAFRYCTELTDVIFEGLNTVVDENIFDFCSNDLVLYAHEDSITANFIQKTDKKFVANLHQWKKEYSLDKEATCIENGQESIHCSICDAKKRDSEVLLPATGHTEIVDEAVAATCEKDGLTEGCHCAVCGKVLEEQVLESATGHTEIVDEAVAATCEKDGLTEGCHCVACGKVLEEQVLELATGHTEIVDEAIAATCEKDGLTEGCHCVVCGKVLKKQLKKTATGHEWEDDYTVDKKATCTETGMKSIHCKRCNATKDLQEIAKNDHAPDIAVEENVVTPTCYKKGSYDRVVYCIDCKEELTREIKEMKKIAHKYKKHITNATLTENGDIVMKCEVCNEVASKSSIYHPKTISLSKTSYVYSGKTQKPKVTVKGADGKTIASSNYIVTYSRGCKNVGSYTVKITFKGNYSGTIVKTYMIVPKGTTFSKVTAISKGFYIKWKKQLTQTTGYQVQYSTNKKFTDAKTTTISKNTNVSKKVTKMARKKKYYIRIRTYKKINGKTYYSSWSTTKTIKTK